MPHNLSKTSTSLQNTETNDNTSTIYIFWISTWDMLVLLKFGQFSPERKETGSLGTTESEV